MSHYVASWADGFRVTWRNLTWSEYNSFKDRFERSPFDEPMDVALDVYRTICIDGPDPKFVPAGIPAYVCKQQMIDNPFSGAYKDVASAVGLARRAVTGNYLLSMKAIIASTLNYKIEEMDQWDANIFFLRLAQAEVALGRTFDPMDPKAPKDTKGNLLKPKGKDLTNSQQKAISRVKERDSRG